MGFRRDRISHFGATSAGTFSVSDVPRTRPCVGREGPEGNVYGQVND